MNKVLLLILSLLLLPTVVNAEASKTKDSVTVIKNGVPTMTLSFRDLQSKVFFATRKFLGAITLLA